MLIPTVCTGALSLVTISLFIHGINGASFVSNATATPSASSLRTPSPAPISDAGSTGRGIASAIQFWTVPVLVIVLAFAMPAVYICIYRRRLELLRIEPFQINLTRTRARRRWVLVSASDSHRNEQTSPTTTTTTVASGDSTLRWMLLTDVSPHQQQQVLSGTPSLKEMSSFENRLPVFRYGEKYGLNPEQGDAATCSICLSDFEANDELRDLPCGHHYHRECIDDWLQRTAVCPVCRLDVAKALINEPNVRDVTVYSDIFMDPPLPPTIRDRPGQDPPVTMPDRGDQPTVIDVTSDDSHPPADPSRPLNAVLPFDNSLNEGTRPSPVVANPVPAESFNTNNNSNNNNNNNNGSQTSSTSRPANDRSVVIYRSDSESPVLEELRTDEPPPLPSVRPRPAVVAFVDESPPAMVPPSRPVRSSDDIGTNNNNGFDDRSFLAPGVVLRPVTVSIQNVVDDAPPPHLPGSPLMTESGPGSTVGSRQVGLSGN